MTLFGFLFLGFSSKKAQGSQPFPQNRQTPLNAFRFLQKSTAKSVTPFWCSTGGYERDVGKKRASTVPSTLPKKHPSVERLGRKNETAAYAPPNGHRVYDRSMCANRYPILLDFQGKVLINTESNVLKSSRIEEFPFILPAALQTFVVKLSAP